MGEHMAIQFAVENWLRRSDIEFDSHLERERFIGRVATRIQEEGNA